MITTQVARGTVRLRVTIAAGNVGKELTITATAAGRPMREVRGWRRVKAPTIAVVIDHEAELGVPVRYAVLINGVEIEAVTLVVPSEWPLLTDPIRGRSVPVVIQEWPETHYERAGHELEISGSPDPVIIDGVEMRPTSTLTLIHPIGGDSAKVLEDLIAQRSVVRIRPSCSGLPTEWVSVRGRRRRRFSTAPDSALVDVLELRHLGQPNPDEPAAGNTLGDLNAAVPGKLADIVTRWPGVLADIAFEDLTR